MDFLVHHMLRASARREPEKEALVHGNERLTFAGVNARVMSLASGLQSAGLERGERVGIILDAGIPQVLSIFAVSVAGGVFVPINSALMPAQISHIARDCGISGLISTSAKLKQLLPL